MKILKPIMFGLFLSLSLFGQAQEFDCDCTGEEEMNLCVDLGDGLVVPMSECMFDCINAEEEVLSLGDCDDLIDFEDGDFEDDDFGDVEIEFDFDCDCTGEEEMDLCVDLGGIVVPMSQCMFDCVNAEEEVFVLGDCDDVYDFEDGDFEDGDFGDIDYDFDCDCTGEEEMDLCVDLGGIVVPMSQCMFDCINVEEEVVVLGDCDDLIDFEDGDFGDWEDGEFEDWEDCDYGFDCDCPEDDELDLCVDLGDGFVVPMSQCMFDCINAEEEILALGDCDDLIDWEENDFEDWGDMGTDCDCTGEEEQDLCVDLGDGLVVLMSQCMFDCINAEEEVLTLGDCDDLFDFEDGDFGDWEDDFEDWDDEEFDEDVIIIDCDCSEDEEMTLCVDLGDGFIVPISECLFNCISSEFDFLELVDCGEFDFEEFGEVDYEGLLGMSFVGVDDINSSETNGMLMISDMTVYPNPASSDFTRVKFNSNQLGETGRILVINVLGSVVAVENIQMIKGWNDIQIDINALESGFYKVSIETNNQLLNTSSLIIE